MDSDCYFAQEDNTGEQTISNESRQENDEDDSEGKGGALLENWSLKKTGVDGPLRTRCYSTYRAEKAAGSRKNSRLRISNPAG